MVQTKYVN